MNKKRNKPDHSKPLRVGVVTTSFPVVIASFSGIFVKRLVDSIAKKTDVTVLVPCPDKDVDQQREKSYHIEYFSYGIKKWQRLAHYPGGIPDIIRRRDPAMFLLPLFVPAMFIACLRLAKKVDIIHSNWSVPGLISAVAGWLKTRSTITTLRGEDVNRTETSLFFRCLLKLTIKLNCRVVVVSEAMKVSLGIKFPRLADRIVFIPNGVAVKSPEARPVFRSPLRLLTVGSLIRRKRIETMLSALSQIQDSDKIIFRIVGEGPERFALEKIAHQFSIRNQVEFTGGVPPENIEEHLQWADIFVFTSESEGRPNAILEAMAAGLPIVATDIPGVSELTGKDAGMLFPVGDVSALAKCIQTMLENPDGARKMGYSARQRIERMGLTWDYAASMYMTLYNDVIKHSVEGLCAD